MPENGGPKGGWSEWSNHVLLTLEKLEKKVDKLEENIHQDKIDTQRDLVTLQTKASILGGIAGFISSILIAVIGGLIVYNLTTNEVNKQNMEQPKTSQQIEMVVPNNERRVSSFSVDDEGNV